MTRFALLVRGINVGGKNKVVMAELREELQTIGLDVVETYINSGNIFFESAASKAELVDLLGHFFRDHYPFIQSFSLFSAEDYAQDLAALPAWWQEDLARKDVLFYTEGLDQDAVWELVSSFSLGDEIIHRGSLWDLLGQILRRDLYKDSLPQTSPQDAGLPSVDHSQCQYI